jgi:hypothetical protein
LSYLVLSRLRLGSRVELGTGGLPGPSRVNTKYTRHTLLTSLGKLLYTIELGLQSNEQVYQISTNIDKTRQEINVPFARNKILQQPRHVQVAKSQKRLSKVIVPRCLLWKLGVIFFGSINTIMDLFRTTIGIPIADVAYITP